MPSFQQQKKQQLEKPQSLIDPDEFSLRLIQVLNKDYPDFGEWNGASGMEILKQTTQKVVKDFEERVYRYLEQHVRDMDLHARSLLAEHHNFCDDINRLTLVLGMRRPLVGENWSPENDQETQQDTSHECPIDP